ncbi:MAG TPA: flagellar hook-length control protein FliK [Burkholderiaceae bacterium]|nr:flagellar hook-length control protein FliK [Burkholderiaceae bacterium]
MALGQFTANTLRMGDIQRPADREPALATRTASSVDAFREQMARENQNREAMQAQARRQTAGTSPQQRTEPAAEPSSQPAARGDEAGAAGHASARASSSSTPPGRSANARPPSADTPASAQAETGSTGTPDAESETSERSLAAAGAAAADRPQAGTIAALATAQAPATDPASGGDDDALAGDSSSAVGAASKQRHRELVKTTDSVPAEHAASGASSADNSTHSVPEKMHTSETFRTPGPLGLAGTHADASPLAASRIETAFGKLSDTSKPDDMPSFHLPARADSPAFASQLGDRVGLMLRTGTGEARLILHPEALGTVAVALKVHDTEAKVAFSAGTEAARAALDAALPQLKELLANQGVQLVSASTQTHANPGETGRGATPFGHSARDGHDQHRSGTGSSNGWRNARLQETAQIDGALGPAAGLRRPGSGRLSIFA